jgi:hypothetical protein
MANLELLTKIADLLGDEVIFKGNLDKHNQMEALKAAILEIEEWRACARYDALMTGPRFQGWDMSQLNRCRKQFIETPNKE